jgi:hypothetical protein
MEQVPFTAETSEKPKKVQNTPQALPANKFYQGS